MEWLLKFAHAAGMALAGLFLSLIALYFACGFAAVFYDAIKDSHFRHRHSREKRPRFP
jgi:hypothetical protein